MRRWLSHVMRAHGDRANQRKAELIMTKWKKIDSFARTIYAQSIVAEIRSYIQNHFVWFFSEILLSMRRTNQTHAHRGTRTSAEKRLYSLSPPNKTLYLFYISLFGSYNVKWHMMILNANRLHFWQRKCWAWKHFVDENKIVSNTDYVLCKHLLNF